MGANTKQLRTRIKSVDSTLHLTRAMGLVASSKIRRAMEAMRAGREYEHAVRGAIAPLISSSECRKSPYMRAATDAVPNERTALVVIAGDRGLAGGYNANIFRAMREYEGATVYPIGKRACDRYKHETVRAESFDYAEARALADRLCREFAEGCYDRVGILCTHYVSMLSQEAEVRWVLPLVAEEGEHRAGTIFEPDEMTILNAAVPEYLAGILVAAARESFASEVAARRTAMDSASKNAQEMIDELQLEYNRARQGAITQEITEIVAGSNSGV